VLLTWPNQNAADYQGSEVTAKRGRNFLTGRMIVDDSYLHAFLAWVRAVDRLFNR
jgi:hypothetical protein